MITVPVFAELQLPSEPAGPTIHPRLVAAVRWDYEYGLLSHAQLVHKYRLVLQANSIRGIIYGETQPHIKAAKHALAWAKTSWRRIR